MIMIYYYLFFSIELIPARQPSRGMLAVGILTIINNIFNRDMYIWILLSD
jgi:hypothetical protein